MTKAVGYIRVSTQGQVRDGYSLAYQRDEIVCYCTDNGIELLKIYEDKGISGAKVDEDGLTVEREGLQSMLADLASVFVDCVIVLNTSRLWSSDMAKVLIQRELKLNRVDVRAIEQQMYSIYNDDPNDFLVNGMLELLGQYQGLEIALKLSRGRRKKAEQGGYAGDGAAFGYHTAKGQKVLILSFHKLIRSDVHWNSYTNPPHGHSNKLHASCGHSISGKESWYKLKMGASLHPDLGHPDPIGPHWDYTGQDGQQYRILE